ncbi:MAG: SpoIIE family protein phosphatase [Cyanobacteria bacterium P01_A01_bin.40]
MNTWELIFVLSGGRLVLDESLQILEVSPEFCDEFACQPETLIGKRLENLFSVKERKGKFAFHNRFSRNLDDWLDITIAVSINRTEYMTRLRMIKQADHWLANIEKILADERDLFSVMYLKTQRWENVVRNSSEGIAIIDRQGNLVEFNSNFLKIMQFHSVHGVLLNEEAINQKNIFDLLEHESSAELRAYFEGERGAGYMRVSPLSNHLVEVAKKKKKSKLRLEIQYKQYCLELELTPIRLPAEGFAGCSFVVKDITAQKQLEVAQQEILELNHQLQAENLRMSAELDFLKRMQQLILPKTEELAAVKDLEIAGYMKPADEVGGDYYDVLCLEGVVTIGIGDVTGHGLESGLLMVMAQTAVRTLKEIREVDPVIFLDTLNRTIYKNIKRMKTHKNLTLAVLNYADGIFSLSGQHEEAIVIRQGGTVERIDTIDLGFPIGLDQAIAKYINPKTVKLNPGEVLALYTDGITESENLAGEFYGIDRLCKVLSFHWQQSAEVIKETVIEDVRQHIGKQKVYDDITLVVLKQRC